LEFGCVRAVFQALRGCVQLDFVEDFVDFFPDKLVLSLMEQEKLLPVLPKDTHNLQIHRLWNVVVTLVLGSRALCLKKSKYLGSAVAETFAFVIPAINMTQSSRHLFFVDILWPRGGESRRGCLVSGVSGLGKMYFPFGKFRILMGIPVLLTKSSDSRERSPRLMVLVVPNLGCCSPWKDWAGTEFKVIKLPNTELTGLVSYKKCILHPWVRQIRRKKYLAAEARVCSFKAQPICDFIK
jgi:hypothetical protein